MEGADQGERRAGELSGGSRPYSYISPYYKYRDGGERKKQDEAEGGSQGGRLEPLKGRNNDEQRCNVSEDIGNK